MKNIPNKQTAIKEQCKFTLFNFEGGQNWGLWENKRSWHTGFSSTLGKSWDFIFETHLE